MISSSELDDLRREVLNRVTRRDQDPEYAGLRVRLKLLAAVFEVCELLWHRAGCAAMRDAPVPREAPPRWSGLHVWTDKVFGSWDNPIVAYQDLYLLFVAIAAECKTSATGEIGASWPKFFPAWLAPPFGEPGGVLLWPEREGTLRALAREMDDRDSAPEPFVDDRVPHRRAAVDRGWGLLWQPGSPARFRREVALALPVNAERSSKIRLVLSPLIGESAPRFLADPSPGHVRTTKLFHADALVPAGALQGQLQELLGAIGTSGVAPELLALPELMVDGEGWRLLMQQLPLHAFAPELTAAGSFHLGQHEQRRNAMPILAKDGRELRWVTKSGYFRLSGKKLKAVIGPSAQHEPDGAIFMENIAYGRTLVLAETSLGRVAFGICADVLDMGTAWLNAVSEAEPDLMVIVSMTSDTRVFEELAQRLCRLRTATVFVNAGLVLKRSDGAGDVSGPLAAMLVLPFKGGTGGVPETRWGFWVGEPKARCLRGTAWVSPGSDGVSPMTILPCDHGVLVDLTSFQRAISTL